MRGKKYERRIKRRGRRRRRRIAGGWEGQGKVEKRVREKRK